MAILQIEIQNSKFISYKGVVVEKFTERCVEGNGWKCQIAPSGNVFCTATYFYKGLERRVKFVIKSGYAKLKLKIGDGQDMLIRSYKLNQSSNDGVIRLSNNFTHPRCAYFREIAFQRFLDEHGITSVRFESANGIYRILQENDGENIVFQEEIDSDGTMELIYNDITARTGKYCVVERDIEVTNATWVIKVVKKQGEIKHRILYTTDNPEKIIGLPKFE